MHGRAHQAHRLWASESHGPGGGRAASAAALLRLPAPQREALAAMVLWEMSYEEAAATLGAPVGTVKSRVSRARRKLRAALGSEAEATPRVRARRAP